MSAAWRLGREVEAAGAFSGEGARIHGGRWNRTGTAVVDVSGSLALAALETFVHLGKAALRLKFVCLRLEIPDEIKVDERTVAELPANWREEPPPLETQEAGTEWVTRAKGSVLRVPSVLVPSEVNYLLNPAHPGFRRIRHGHPERFAFDPRMGK